MSSRQKLRLLKQRQQQEEHEQESEEEEELVKPIKKSVFLMANDSESEGTSSDEASEEQAKDEDEKGSKTIDGTPNDGTIEPINQPQSGSMDISGTSTPTASQPSSAKVDSGRSKSKPSKVKYNPEVEALSKAIEATGISSEFLQNTGCIHNDLFVVDAKQLDVDKIMRSRFGRDASIVEDGEGNGRKQNHIRHRAPKVFHRRLLFGGPKEDWSKPPSLVGGGYSARLDECPAYYRESYGAAASATWYTMEWSEEYRRLDAEYEYIQNTGDANQLVMFLSRFPYHLEGLLQLAMVFARTGHMDRASDLTRRCLFCLEVSFPESLRLGSGANIRFDPSRRENAPLFNALFRHMQMTCMLGCPGLAADIGIILYSLCPEGDPMHVLLMLDHLLLGSGRFEHMLRWWGHGAFTSKSSTEILASSSATQPSACWKWDSIYETMSQTSLWESPVVLGPSPYVLASGTTELLDMKDGANEIDNCRSSAKLGVWHLPNWWFSTALAAFNAEARSPPLKSSATPVITGSEIDGVKLSMTILCAALIRFPFVLRLLVECRKSGIEAKSIRWRTTLAAPLFAGAMDRLPQGSAVHKIANIFVNRNATLWNREEVHRWLLDSASHVIEQKPLCDEVCAGQSQLYESLSNRSEILKYLPANEEDFLEEFPRFPPEANPLDPQFADPRLLARQNIPINRQQIRQQQPGAGGRRRNPNQRRRRVWMDDGTIDDDNEDGEERVDEEFLLQEVERLQELGIDITPEELIAQIRHLAPGNHPGNADPSGLAVDLDSPLMQLFFQTMLPWYHVNPPNQDH